MCAHGRGSEHYPPVTIPNSEIRRVRSQIVEGMEYLIYVALPEGYGLSAENYPAVYLLDAWMSFGAFVEAYRIYRLFDLVPDLVLVGIAHAGSSLQDHLFYRARDYTPTELPADEIERRYGPEIAALTPASGGAPNFLRFIREELFPFMEREYRLDPADRALFGYSFGGLFALYTLFNLPQLFRRYFIGSAPGWWDDYVVFQAEAQYAGEHTALPAKVFASVGGKDSAFIPSWERLRDRLNQRNYAGLELMTVMFDGEDHLECGPLAHMHALRALYLPP